MPLVSLSLLPSCFLQLCFFAHTSEQLRVTARSLAAQQAQANAGKGKAGKGSKQDSASTAASNGSSGDLSALTASPAAEQLLLALCADDGAALSGLLQKLGAGEDTSLDTATTAAIAALLQDSTLARSSSAPSDTTMQPAAVAEGGSADVSQGSSPRTPPRHAITLPAQAAAAQRKDTAPMPSTAAANLGSASSGICSVQEHIRNVMQGKVTAEQVQRDTAARALHAGAHRSPAMQLPGLAPAHSPGAHSLLPMQGPSLDILSPGMQTFLLDGQLCSPQCLPVGGGVMGPNSGGMVVSCAGPAKLQVPGFVGDLGAMPGSAISSYGSGCFLQTAASMDAAGFGSRAAPMDGSQCSAMGAAPGLAGPLEALPPVLLQQLSLQGQGAAVGPGSLIPLLGAPSLPALGSPGQLPALSAGMPQQAVGTQYAQQQAAAVLMQRQQATTDGLWAVGRQGVGGILGGGAGVGFGSSASTFTPRCVGLSG